MNGTTGWAAPLRDALIWCFEHMGAPVRCTTLAEIASDGDHQVATARAKAFLTTLVPAGIVVLSPAGATPGPGWKAWISSPSRSKPRRAIVAEAVAAAAPAVRSIRMAMATRLQEAMEERGWTQRELALRAGIHPVYLNRMLKRCTPMPLPQMVLCARALETSVDDLATPLEV